MKTIPKKKSRLMGHCLLAIFCVFTQFAHSQKTKSPVNLTGDLGLYGDFYHMYSDTLGAVAPRRPDALGRLVINASINTKYFSMPITIVLPSGQYGVIITNVPAIPNDPIKNFKCLLKNPLNRMGIAPKFKWVQILLGSQIPRYSELSVGDLAVFGAGVNLTPGKFRFSYFGGKSQLAIESDSARNIKGLFARKIYSAKVGIGHEDSSHLYLIATSMKDDTSSIRNSSFNPMPQTGILSAVDLRLNLGKHIYIKGEIAGSAFTRNMHSRELPPTSPSIPDNIFTPKESSRIDYASVVSIGGAWKYFSIKSTGRYYGDGFVSLGYPYMQMDRLEITVDPQFSLFKNKVQFSGSIGQRVNNLSGIRAATSTQTLKMANLSLQLSERLSLAASYSNFGFRNSILNDTFRVEMVTSSWSVSPSYYYINKKSMHSFNVMYAQNSFNDLNIVSGAVNDNLSNNGVFSYVISLIKRPLSFSSILSYFDNSTSYGKLVSQSANLNLGYKFFKKKLGATAGLTLTENKIGNSSSGTQVMGMLGLKCTLKKFQIGINGSINLFKYGNNRPGISYRENLLRTSLTYKFK